MLQMVKLDDSSKSNMEYRRPAAEAHLEKVVLGSRFVARAARAEDVASVREQLRTIQETLPDAHHHAYAFRVGYGASVVEGKSDNGEPKGTAGQPILSLIRGSELGDLLVVVSRYFGGRKLGTGGLVRAYGGAAREVLEKLKVEWRVERTQLSLRIPYPLLARVRYLMKSYDIQEVTSTFHADAHLVVSIAAKERDQFQNAITELSAALITIQAND